MTGKMLDKLCDQINKEIYSSYLYLGMHSYAASAGLEGVANWFSVQVQEELEHAKKIYDYINQNGGKVTLDKIDRPPQEYSSAKDLFVKTLEHERTVTGLINECVDVAVQEKDKATEIFLQWFVTEQVEEEDNASTILNKFELAGGEGSGLFMIDRDLASRSYAPSGSDQG